MDRSEFARVRLAHFSDIHVTAPRCAWRREDWLNKRFAAWFNLRVLGRGHRFRQTDAVLEALGRDLALRAADHVVFSGDATAMGFPEEVERAARLIRVDRWPGLAVPGNHDYCTPRAVRSGDFERWFAPWLVGRRTGEEVYPFAQRVGDLWLVAVNSATANRWAWDASGAVGADQLDRLDRLLASLESGRRVLVTHYPVAVASGRPEPRSRHLRDLRGLIDVSARGGVCLWLHGHRHNAYLHPAGELAPFPVICAGSATQTGHWSYGEYTIHGGRLSGSRRVFDPDQDEFREENSFELELPPALSPCPVATPR